MRWVSAALLAAACAACPKAPCGAVLAVDLRVEAWATGAWSLTVADADDTWLACAIVVPPGDVPPTEFDLACDDQVERAAFVPDTGGTQDPLLLTLEARRRVDLAPPRVTVRLTRDGVALVDEAREVAWREVSRQAPGCLEPCRAATLDVRVP